MEEKLYYKEEILKIKSLDELHRAPINSKVCFPDGRVETKTINNSIFPICKDKENIVFTLGFIERLGEKYKSLFMYDSNFSDKEDIPPFAYIASQDMDYPVIYALTKENKRIRNGN
jgi:hypothetical protein